MKKLLIFFDLGQTLLDESRFINYFDTKLLELINGFGGRIDLRSYITLKNNIIKNRSIGYGSIEEIIINICKLILPKGYDKIILHRLIPVILFEKNELICLAKGTKKVLESLSSYCEIGIISNQMNDPIEPLIKENILSLFRKIFIISDTGTINFHEKLFIDAIKYSEFPVSKCIMIGDRLDIDIYPANKIGMKTIRVTNSLFHLQSAINKYEIPDYTIEKLDEIPRIIKDIL
ncbi:MAG TPA: HAD family hydrolase [Nitrososphaeraceae archaeon]|nr:HAD family hydrolase [Nitrososphaeraceae archaeon]